MSTDIKIRKKVADGYETFYPTNNAQNVIRDTNNFNYIDGTTLLEVIQDMANKYIPHRCANWKLTQEFPENVINQDSVLDGDGKFMCIVTPQYIDNQYKMVISASYGGVWKTEAFPSVSYYNIDTESQINKILGIKVKKVLGGYCAVVTGVSSLSSTILNSYTIFFPIYDQKYIIYNAVTMFTGNKIPLA